VLVGVDARSTYCYLLAAEARDENTWGFHLLETMEQGLNPEYTIADAAKGLRAGQKAAFGIHHVTAICFIQQQCQSLTNILSRQLEQLHKGKVRKQMELAKQQSRRESALDQAHPGLSQAERCGSTLQGCQNANPVAQP